MVDLTMRWGGKPILDQVNLTVQPGEVGVRINQLTGSSSTFGAGPVLVLPSVQAHHHLVLHLVSKLLVLVSMLVLV